MVHDQLAMYFKYDNADHAVYLSHLLRDREAAGVRWGEAWTGEMAKLLREMNAACHVAKGG